MVHGSPPPRSTKHAKNGKRSGASEKRCRVGLFPRLVGKFPHSSETLCSAASADVAEKDEVGGGENSACLLSAPAVTQASNITNRDEVVRRRRQRRIKKLEHQEELQKQKSKLTTTPGERIFPLPSKVRPISLFIRMGSLPSEQEPVPLEYYGASDEGEAEERMPPVSTAAAAMLAPHPAALQTKQLFHLGEGFATASSTQTKTIKGRPRTMPLNLPVHTTRLPKRPFSIQIPPVTSVSSTLNEEANDVDGRKRPRSLRFLDPRDQKLYAAISHKDFLAQLRHQAEECTLRRFLEDVTIADTEDAVPYGHDQRDDQAGGAEEEVDDLNSAEPATNNNGEEDSLRLTTRPSQGNARLLSPSRLCASSAPPTLTDTTVDTERSNPQDWTLSEAIGGDDILPRPPPPRYIGNFARPQSMPIFPKEVFSLESSDVSGCEADAEERHRPITNRRGSVAGR